MDTTEGRQCEDKEKTAVRKPWREASKEPTLDLGLQPTTVGQQCFCCLKLLVSTAAQQSNVVLSVYSQGLVPGHMLDKQVDVKQTCTVAWSLDDLFPMVLASLHTTHIKDRQVCVLSHLSHVPLFATLSTVALQTPLSIESLQASGLP